MSTSIGIPISKAIFITCTTLTLQITLISSCCSGKIY